MASKNVTEVLIGGKIYTLSGYESEEYLQRVAGYLNNKITEMKALSGYNRMNPDMRSLMLNLNVADDYFKLKKQADQLNDQITAKDKELYEIKHELIQTQMKLESMTASLAHYQDSRQPASAWDSVPEAEEDLADSSEEELIPVEEEDEAVQLTDEDPDTDVLEDSDQEYVPVDEDAAEENTAEAEPDIRTPETVLTPSAAVGTAKRGIPVPQNYAGGRRGKSGKNRIRR